MAEAPCCEDQFRTDQFTLSFVCSPRACYLMKAFSTIFSSFRKRGKRRRWLSTVCWSAFFMIFAVPAPAVIFYSTADPDFNTVPPTGSLANSGWQWVGSWSGFQGTPIGPHHFLTARHVGGNIGDVFALNGINYPTVAFFDDTVSDLRICEVAGTFPSWAPLYRSNGEVRASFVVLGRGLTRGTEVKDAVTHSLRGWQWGAGDGRLRWGQNVFDAVIDGGSYWGPLLRAGFYASGGVNEAHLAIGDSSGPVFIDDGSAWKLAGVAAAVDGPFNTTNSGAGFNAAIFDTRGLYTGNASAGWSLVNGSQAVPSGFYVTRVSIRADWIDGIVPPMVQDDSTDVPLASRGLMAVFGAAVFGAGAFFLQQEARVTGSIGR